MACSRVTFTFTFTLYIPMHVYIYAYMYAYIFVLKLCFLVGIKHTQMEPDKCWNRDDCIEDLKALCGRNEEAFRFKSVGVSCKQ